MKKPFVLRNSKTLSIATTLSTIEAEWRIGDMVCVLCGKHIEVGREIHVKIGESDYVFDKEECVSICEKLSSVYGDDFCINLTV